MKSFMSIDRHTALCYDPPMTTNSIRAPKSVKIVGPQGDDRLRLRISFQVYAKIKSTDRRRYQELEGSAILLTIDPPGRLKEAEVAIKKAIHEAVLALP